MSGSITDTVKLHNGVEMPLLGLGVFQTKDGKEVINAVKWALQAGYRHIDTAAAYGNEVGVGQAIRESGVPREEIFVTTKAWNGDMRAGNTPGAFETSLHKLGLDYIDLYLIHWPVETRIEAWRDIEEIYVSGRARAIGVSNFLAHHLQDLLDKTDVVPMVNQMEYHPRLQQPELQTYCREHKIQYEAWSPLMQGGVLQIPELVSLGKKYGKNPVQITLRWMLQNGVVTIPKSVKQQRIIDNAKLFDFELSAEEMALIDGLDTGKRIGADPDNFNF